SDSLSVSSSSSSSGVGVGVGVGVGEGVTGVISSDSYTTRVAELSSRGEEVLYEFETSVLSRLETPPATCRLSPIYPPSKQSLFAEDSRIIFWLKPGMAYPAKRNGWSTSHPVIENFPTC